jgi:hypothetical protein
MLRYTLGEGFDVAIYSTLYGMTESDADLVIRLLRKTSYTIAPALSARILRRMEYE